MKKILLLIIGIVMFTISSYSQQSINGQVGYSRSMGLVGIDYQFKKIAVGVGYLPVSTPCSDKNYHSFSTNITWCDYTYKRSGYYISAAFASAGYYPKLNSDCDYLSDDVAPLGLLNVGYKLYLGDGLNMKGEIGYGISEIKNIVTFGVTFGYTLKITN